MNTPTITNFSELAMELAKNRTAEKIKAQREQEEIADKELKRRRALIAPLLEVLEDAHKNLSSKLYVLDRESACPHFCSRDRYYAAETRDFKISIAANDVVQILVRNRTSDYYHPENDADKIYAERPADRVIELVPVIVSVIADAIRHR